jgi:hypothetical protein
MIKISCIVLFRTASCSSLYNYIFSIVIQMSSRRRFRLKGDSVVSHLSEGGTGVSQLGEGDSTQTRDLDRTIESSHTNISKHTSSSNSAAVVQDSTVRNSGLCDSAIVSLVDTIKISQDSLKRLVDLAGMKLLCSDVTVQHIIAKSVVTKDGQCDVCFAKPGHDYKDTKSLDICRKCFTATMAANCLMSIGQGIMSPPYESGSGMRIVCRLFASLNLSQNAMYISRIAPVFLDLIDQLVGQ